MPIEKLRPHFTFDEQRIEQLKKVTPECFADGKINWDVLKEALGNYTESEDPDAEHFGLYWPGKKEARKLASTPSIGTLVPMTGEGIDEDSTHNIFIEGENLEVLKLLQKSYAGRVKMIYIDPPYNTGNDFVYDDNFSETLEEYFKRTGQIDEEGRKLTTNTKADGRFHSKWLSMIYPRLRLARNLLTEDGIIFVSIDDNEGHHLRTLMNEIFGENNFLAEFVWRTDGNFDNQAKIKVCHEYILAYTIDINSFPAPPVIDPNTGSNSKLFNESIRNTIVKNGPKNPISSIVLPKGFPCDFETGVIKKRKDNWPHFLSDAIIENAILTHDITLRSGWSSKELLEDFIKNKFAPIKDSKNQETKFLISKTGAIESIKKRTENTSHVISVLTNLGNTQSTSAKLKEAGIYFDYPKPVSLIKYLLQMNEPNEFIVLDFFSGSGSTAQAVYELNAEKKKNIKYILVQLPEKIDEAHLSFSKKYNSISKLSIERIRKASKEIKPKNNDVGLNVYKLQHSNFKIWRNVDVTDLQKLEFQFEQFKSPLVDKWKEEDLFTEVMLIEGFPLDSKIEENKTYKKNKVQIVSSDFCEHRLMICLDKKVFAETIKALEFSDNDIFICLDNAINDEQKATLSDKGLIKTI